MSDKKRPYVFLCTGMSLDGKISNHNKECSPISSDDDRNMLYDARVEADAVMIGANTLRLDDSGLTVKSEERRNQRIAAGKTSEPIKVVVISDASDLKMDGDFFDKGEGKKVVFTSAKTSTDKIAELKKKAEVFALGDTRIDLSQAMDIMYKMGVRTVLVEGGGELIASLLEKDLVDEIRLKIGDIIIGGRNSVTFVEGDGFDIAETKKVKFESVVQERGHIIVKAKIVR